MSGPLGVSHILILKQTLSDHTTLRILKTPHGPSLTFRVEAYSLCKDIRAAQARARSPRNLLDSLTSPLVVLSGMSTDPAPHLKLLSVTIQNMFPAIRPQTVPQLCN